MAVAKIEGELDGDTLRDQMVVPASYQESQVVAESCFLFHAMFQAIHDLHNGLLGVILYLFIVEFMLLEVE